MNKKECISSNQPKKIVVDDKMELIKYYPYYRKTLSWYQDLSVCKQVDNIDFVYDLKRLKAMYNYLSKKGECYYIKYKNRLVGDISLCEGTIGMAICNAYQNKHIGRRSVLLILRRAKEVGLTEVKVEIYSFNEQCKKMCSVLGFKPLENDMYSIDLSTIDNDLIFEDHHIKTKKVVVEDYNPKWVEEFEKIKSEIIRFLGTNYCFIHHVGSTSVPLLPAKPIIDIDVEIESMKEFEKVKELLEANGYYSEGCLGIDGREAFGYVSKPNLMTHHLYVCPSDSSELRRHIKFRNYLRLHSTAREEYGKIKKEAAKLYPRDIDAYCKMKAPIIEKIYKEIGE